MEGEERVIPDSRVEYSVPGTSKLVAKRGSADLDDSGRRRGSAACRYSDGEAYETSPRLPESGTSSPERLRGDDGGDEASCPLRELSTMML